MENVPYEDIEYYNETINNTIRVPEVKMETSTSTVSIVETPNHQISPEPTFYRGRDCHFEDYNFTISYIGAPQSENEFDWRTETGYRKNKLFIGAEICNNEKNRLNGEFSVCNMVGDNIADCQDTLHARVRARTCELQHLIWWTTFDPEKTIRLTPKLVSKKLVCRNSVNTFGEDDPKYSTTWLIPEESFIGTLERSGELLYPGGEILKTQSGYLGIPKQRPPSEPFIATKEVTRTTPVTVYSEKVEFNVVQKQRTVTKSSSVERTRKVAKQRILLDEILLRLGW